MTTMLLANGKARLVKRRAATVEYGRGPSNTRTPGQYDVIGSDGRRVAWIVGRSQRYMDPAWWEVYRFDENGTPRPACGGFKRLRDAAAWAVDRLV